LAENNTAYKGVNELVGLQCQLSVGCEMDLANGPDGSIAQCVEMLPYPCQQWGRTGSSDSSGLIQPFGHWVVRSIRQVHYTAHNSQRTVEIGALGWRGPSML